MLRLLENPRRRRAAWGRVWEGSAGDLFVAVVKTGIGRAAARKAADGLALEGSFDAFVCLGCCGALVPGLRPGELVVATEILDESTGEVLPCAGNLAECFSELARSAGLPLVRGRFLTVTKPILGREAKLRARERTGAVAVEMEAGGIAQAARSRRIPFAAVRSVLDVAEETADVSATAGLAGLPRAFRESRSALRAFSAAWLGSRLGSGRP